MNRRMIARKNRFSDSGHGLKSFTAMVDVVFLLLIYFIATFNPLDVVAMLNVNNPQSGGGEAIEMLKIHVNQTDYTINGRTVDRADLERLIDKLAAFSTDQTVLIICHVQSEHHNLVDVLDLCARNELKKISVLSYQ